MLAAGCAPKKHVTRVKAPAPVAKKAAPRARYAAPPKASAEIYALMRLALEERKTEQALKALEQLAGNIESPLAVEAQFRRVQLLLLTNDARAGAEAEKLLGRRPHHPLIPYLHLWMAQWAEIHQDDSGVLAHTTATLTSPHLTLEAATSAISLGAAAARRSPDWEATQWFLTAAHADTEERRDTWLRDAAARASIAMISRLRDTGHLRDDVGRAFFLHAARARLMKGDMAAVQTLSSWLSKDFPRGNETARVATWAAGMTHKVNIGALLPLTGKYARYGEQALRGMRLALDSVEGGSKVTLRVADTGGNAMQCVAAYRHLTDEGVSMVLGPLLGDCVRTLTSQLHADIPVLSLTSRSELAHGSSGLFVHTLAITMQARFMATHAWRRDERRVVVISMDTPSSQREAEWFARTFSELGGEITDRIELQQNGIDFRPQLRAMRMHTDNEELLAELDDDLVLSVLPEEKTEIRMPVNFDAIYLALPGREVALLAGQLAYVGVGKVHLLGSSRWQDGHLLDDKGRYLDRARFSDVSFPNGASPDLQHLMLAWRGIWGVERPVKLAGLAYDSPLIAVMLTSRLGLAGHAISSELEDPAGFPGLTGHVRFDSEGIGHKDFELFRVRHDRIIPAG